MRRPRLAFTLIELLIAIAILAVLAAVLMPVFLQAKESARRATCASNFHQAHVSVGIYLGDYDDYFMPVNQQPSPARAGSPDRTWVQILLPYARTFSIFRCPSDKSDMRNPDATFDQDLIPGDPYSAYYTASRKVNIGYNYLYLAPVVWLGNAWVAVPRSATSISDPSRTLLFADSVGSRNGSGQPNNGGSWLVVPPCRLMMQGGRLVDSFGFNPNTNVRLFGSHRGWDVGNPNSPFLYGGVWGWHFKKATIARVDGSVTSVAPSALGEGCVVLDEWRGVIKSPRDYPWDSTGDR